MFRYFCLGMRKHESLSRALRISIDARSVSVLRIRTGVSQRALILAKVWCEIQPDSTHFQASRLRGRRRRAEFRVINATRSAAVHFAVLSRDCVKGQNVKYPNPEASLRERARPAFTEYTIIFRSTVRGRSSASPFRAKEASARMSREITEGPGGFLSFFNFLLKKPSRKLLPANL